MRNLCGVCTAACLLAIAPAAGSQTVMAYRVETPAPRDLTARFSTGEIAILEKINRADRDHLPALPQLAVPERWTDDERAYSQMPRRYEAAAGIARLLVVHLPGQMFGAYESGDLVRWGPVSSGAAGSATPAGTYHLTWRALSHVSTVNREWVLSWYFNFDNEQGRAFHEYELPGRPASHGCIRMLERDAQWLYEWGRGWQLDARETTIVETGTPVRILGDYVFSAPPPWRSAAWLRQTVALPPGAGE